MTLPVGSSRGSCSCLQIQYACASAEVPVFLDPVPKIWTIVQFIVKLKLGADGLELKTTFYTRAKLHHLAFKLVSVSF